MKLFSAKIKFLTQKEDGTIKKASEEFLVNAKSFIEAEANLTKELSEEIPDFELVALSIKKFDEIIETLEEDHKYFKVVVSHTSIDIDSNKEKKVKSTSLIQGLNADFVSEKVKQIWSNSASDWSVVSIAETNYLRII